jgi:hypothetical protein
MKNGNKAGKKNDVMIRIETRSRPIHEAEMLFRGKSQGQIAALHVVPAKSGQAAEVHCTFTPDATFKVKNKEGVTIKRGKDDITIRGYFHKNGVKVFTGNANLARLADHPAHLDALAKALESVRDRKGETTERLHLSGKNETTLVNVGTRWINLTPNHAMKINVIDIDSAAGKIYGFRADEYGRRYEIAEMALKPNPDLVDASRWNTMVSLPASGKTVFYDASRIIRDRDGRLSFQVAFTDGYTRACTLAKNGEAMWGEPWKDEQIVLTRAWFDGNAGLVSQVDASDGTELVLYPKAEVPKAYQEYVNAPA